MNNEIKPKRRGRKTILSVAHVIRRPALKGRNGLRWLNHQLNRLKQQGVERMGIEALVRLEKDDPLRMNGSVRYFDIARLLAESKGIQLVKIDDSFAEKLEDQLFFVWGSSALRRFDAQLLQPFKAYFPSEPDLPKKLRDLSIGLSYYRSLQMQTAMRRHGLQAAIVGDFHGFDIAGKKSPTKRVRRGNFVVIFQDEEIFDRGAKAFFLRNKRVLLQMLCDFKSGTLRFD